MFGRMFRKKDPTELWAEAEGLLAERRFGDAKLAFDRVESRAGSEQPELAARARERAVHCCDRLAEARGDEAKRFALVGEIELAREELRHALDTARSDGVLAKLRELERSIEQRDAVEQAAAPPPLSDEERLTLLASAWEPLQAEELESYGEPMMKALLAIEDERGDAALALLEPLLASAKEPSYLWLEVGRARLVKGDLGGAAEALRSFLSRIGPEEGGGARLMAHRELARMAHDQGDRERALAELEACAAALEDDPRPYLDLGNYLRLIGRSAEAVEVLEMCASLFPEGSVEWPVSMELALACADAGDSERGLRGLEAVLEQLASRGHLDFPPPAVIALAKLHEERGNLTRAADLYRALSEGSDTPNHALYHREAARLLDALGMAEEAARMRARGEALEPGS